MSDILFPHTRLSRRALRLRLAAVGVVGAMAVGGITGVLGMETLGIMSGDVRVTVHLPTTGDTLGINSDVKYAGLRVGRVVSVDPGVTQHDPTAVVLVQSREAAEIPAAVKARVLPGTLFGNEYVDLVAAGSGAVATADHLTSGDDVPADRSVRTLRLMDTFAATQRLLAAVDPSQWDTALSQLAGALAGRGDDIARFMADAEKMLGRWTTLQPAVIRDLHLLATNADTADGIEPQLVRALRASRPLARTLVAHAADTDTLLGDTVGLLDGSTGLTAFLAVHGPDVARLLDATAATLQTFADRHPAFASLLAKVPTLLRNGAAAVKNGRIQMEGVLAPQMMSPYTAKDCPRYGDLAGPRCRGAR